MRAGSDEMLSIGSVLSFGFAMGLLIGGASRLLVAAASDPGGDDGPDPDGSVEPAGQRATTRTCKAVDSAPPAGARLACYIAAPTVLSTVAPRSDTHQEVTDMDDVKKTYREGEQDTKEAWRKADGDESLADKVGNAGDELRKQAGNLGDDLDDRRRPRRRYRQGSLAQGRRRREPGRQGRQRRRRHAPHHGRPALVVLPSNAKKPPLDGGFFASCGIRAVRSPAIRRRATGPVQHPGPPLSGCGSSGGASAEPSRLGSLRGPVRAQTKNETPPGRGRLTVLPYRRSGRRAGLRTHLRAGLRRRDRRIYRRRGRPTGCCCMRQRTARQQR